MSDNNKGPWDIIGWGIIAAVILRVIPFVIVGGIVFWLIGGFDFVAGLLKAMIGPIIVGIIILIVSLFAKENKS